MTNVPYYLPSARFGNKYGNGEIVDGIVKDGLTDVYNNFLMGNAAELCAKKYEIDRNGSDEYAIESYKRSQKAFKEGNYKEEISPIEINLGKKGIKIICEDDEVANLNEDKLKALKPVFEQNGTVTAGNASTISDGASTLILMSEEKMKELNLKPIALIRGFADSEQEPKWFTTTPSIAIPKALKQANLNVNQVDIFEINEAFSCVALANMKILGIEANKCNIWGGAVSMGHPLGNSGSRIVVTLCSILAKKNMKIGVAAICNGGGGASAIVIERV